MAITYKILGQSNPTGNTLTTAYTVPNSTSAVLSTVTVCNQANTAASFRVAARPNGESIASKHYINYDTPLPANDTISLTLGITLGANDVISVYASSGNVSFNVFGSELT